MTLALVVVVGWLVLSLPIALLLGRAIGASSAARRPPDHLEGHPAVDEVARARHVAGLG
jgi:hypothetical protein